MPQQAPASPTVLRIILGRQLQELRDKAGMSCEQAAGAIYTSEWTLRRMEKAEVSFKLNYIKSLLITYGITDTREIDAFLGLAREANKPGWWHSYTDILPAWFRVFPGLEQAAALIRGYEPQCVPGLLQTRGYAHALATAGYPQATPAQTSRRVELRMARQQILAGDDAPQLWAILDEAAIHRVVGGKAVMQAQLLHLADSAIGGKITVQVLPFGAGPHPGQAGPFIILGFAELTEPEVVYMETVGGNLYVDKPEEVKLFTTVFDQLRAVALSPAQSAAMLQALAGELG